MTSPEQYPLEPDSITPLLKSLAKGFGKSPEADITTPPTDSFRDAAEHQTSIAYPRYMIVGALRGNRSFESWVGGQLDRSRDQMVVPGQTPPTDEEWDFLTRLHKGIVAVGDQLGVDLRNKILPRHQYRIFPNTESYVRGLRPIIGEKISGNGGQYWPTLGPLWARREDPEANLSGLAHEAIHGIALTEVEGTIQSVAGATGNVDLHMHNGYMRLCDGKSGVNEILADMLMDRVLQTIKYPGRILYSYSSLDSIGSAIVRLTADRLKRDPQEIEDLLTLGMLTGDLKGIKLVGQALGAQVLDRILHLTGNENKAQLQQMAHEFGLGQLPTVDDNFKWRKK